MIIISSLFIYFKCFCLLTYLLTYLIFPAAAVAPSTAQVSPSTAVNKPAPTPAPVVKPVASVTATGTVVNKPAATVAASQTVSSGKARDVKIASASYDTTVKIWEVSASSGQFGNTSTLTGHTKVRLTFF